MTVSDDVVVFTIGKKKRNSEIDIPHFLPTKTAKTEQLLNADVNREVLAIDCEMVGIADYHSALARCSLVKWNGDVVYDKYVLPNQPIVDYRTQWSGIRQADLLKATPFDIARKEIISLIEDCILIGHTLHKDLEVLKYSHPQHLLCDINRCQEVREMLCLSPSNLSPVKLRAMSEALLHRSIQTGEHCSIEDARATIDIFKLVYKRWLARNAEALQLSKFDQYFDDIYWPIEFRNE